MSISGEFQKLLRKVKIIVVFESIILTFLTMCTLFKSIIVWGEILYSISLYHRYTRKQKHWLSFAYIIEEWEMLLVNSKKQFVLQTERLNCLIPENYISLWTKWHAWQLTTQGNHFLMTGVSHLRGNLFSVRISCSILEIIL